MFSRFHFSLTVRLCPFIIFPSRLDLLDFDILQDISLTSHSIEWKMSLSVFRLIHVKIWTYYRNNERQYLVIAMELEREI
jgi:hypothetical protein